MKNKWKAAFFALLIIFTLTTLFLIYSILDQGVTLTYMKEGYEDTEYDLLQISKVIEGKLTFDDFKEISDRYPDLEDSSSLELNRIKIEFGLDKKVKKVTTQW